MAEAVLPPLVEPTTATLRAETAAAQAGKGLAATVQPKKRNSGALRRGAQAALEASSRPVEASRGPLCPLTPTRDRTGDLGNKTEMRSPLDHPVAGSTSQQKGVQYRLGLGCSAGSPSPRPTHSRRLLQPQSPLATQSPRTQERPRARSRLEQSPPHSITALLAHEPEVLAAAQPHMEQAARLLQAAARGHAGRRLAAALLGRQLRKRFVAAQRLVSLLQRAARRRAWRRKLAEPMPQWLREAEAELATTPTLALAAPCANLSTIAGAAAACASELQVAMAQLTSRLGEPTTLTICEVPTASTVATSDAAPPVAEPAAAAALTATPLAELAAPATTLAERMAAGELLEPRRCDPSAPGYKPASYYSSAGDVYEDEDDALQTVPAWPAAAIYLLLTDLLREPGDRGCAVSEEDVERAVAEGLDLTVGAVAGDEGEQLQLLWAMRTQLQARPELARCSDFGRFVLQHLKIFAGVVDVLEEVPFEAAPYETFGSVFMLSREDFDKSLADVGMLPANAVPAAPAASAAPTAPAAPAAPADAVDAAAGCKEPLGAFTAPCPARSTATPFSTAHSVFQMAVDGGSCSPAVASAPRRPDGRVAFAVLAAMPTEGPLPSDAGLALIAVLRDLLQLPASKGNGGAPGESAAAAVESVAAAHDGLHGESNLHAVQLLCALCAQLSACPELADCSDLGAFIVKKYAPAAERAGKLVTLKNKRFAELARVVALAPRALYAEFDLDAEAEGESGGEWDDDGSDYDSDDNTTSAQMHRHFAKMASAGIDFGDNALADPWA